MTELEMIQSLFWLAGYRSGTAYQCNLKEQGDKQQSQTRDVERVYVANDFRETKVHACLQLSAGCRSVDCSLEIEK